MPHSLYYIHDPMCSWCWGFDPVLQQLNQQLPSDIILQRRLGGLAPDTHLDMPNHMREYIQRQWKIIQAEIPNIQFNFEFWQRQQPRRSTYPACRAVIAARHFGEKFDPMITRKIQEAYYLKALNPSNDETLIDLASEIGINRLQFKQQFYHSSTATQLSTELEFVRQLPAQGFPSLILQLNQSLLPIKVDYLQVNNMLSEISNAIHRGEY